MVVEGLLYLFGFVLWVVEGGDCGFLGDVVYVVGEV